MTDEETGFLDISARIRRHAESRPQGEALVFEESRLGWRTLDERLDRCANALIALGVRPNDRVAVIAHSCAEYLEMFLGTLRAGACAVPLSPMATADQLRAMLEDSAACVLVLSASTWETARPFVGELASLLPHGRVALDFQRSGWISYDALLRAGPATPPAVAITPDLLFNIIYSSGTTGAPKGIVHDHRTRTVTLDRLATIGFGPGCRTLLATPLYSNTTLAAWLPTFGLGGTTVLMPKFDAGRFLELAAAERITHSVLVPVQYQRILAHPDFARTDLSHFQFKMTTSAPLRAEAKREIAARWPGIFLEMYGMTEGGGICTLDVGGSPDKLDTVGRPAFGCDLRIIDEEGRELPAGAVGETVGRGPVMMQGYHNRADKTAEMLWRDAEGQVFFRSGDMGWFDPEGFLHLSDRKKDMIISGGYNVFATDLEQALAAHPDVADVAVIGVPSPDWGETPLALVVPRANASCEPGELRDWANLKLGKAQRIALVEFRVDLPRNALGKVLKRELRQPYWPEQR